MRRLWIKRHKAYAGCLAKMKVYIEDPENGDTTISGVLCRKLGEVQNGQQKHFSISEDAAKVFVVADKLSRNLYNEVVRIPAGREDVFLSGRNYLKPFSGNPFRFDGVTDEEVLQNRNRVKRSGSVVLAAAIIVGILAGVAAGAVVSAGLLSGGSASAQLQTFEAQGLQLSLTEDFTETNVDGYTASYASQDAAVFLLRENFSLKEGVEALSLEEYGAMVLANNSFGQSTALRSEEGLTVFDYEFTGPNTGSTYYYYTVLCKGPDAFWVVQFSTLAENARENLSFFKYCAKQISFPA